MSDILRIESLSAGYGEAVVLSGIVAVGVGDAAQWYVDGHRKQVGHVLTDIGHAAADAATWEVRLARFA